MLLKSQAKVKSNIISTKPVQNKLKVYINVISISHFRIMVIAQYSKPKVN